MDSICLVLLRLRSVLHSLYKTPCVRACDRFVIALVTLVCGSHASHYTPFVTSVDGLLHRKLSTSFREWLHVLQANGRSLMHKHVATSEQGFHFPSSEQPAMPKGF